MTNALNPSVAFIPLGLSDVSVNSSSSRSDLDSRTLFFALALIALIVIATCVKYAMSYLINPQQAQEVNYDAVVNALTALRVNPSMESSEITKMITFLAPFPNPAVFKILGQNAPLHQHLVIPDGQNQDTNVNVWDFNGRLDVTRDASKVTPLIGYVKTVNIWKVAPQVDAGEDVPNQQKVRLPEGYSIAEFNEDRQRLQEGVVDGSGLKAPEGSNLSDEQYAHQLTYRLGGVVVEGEYQYDTEHILRGNMENLPHIEGNKVPMHVILTTGLNFAGYGGGGVPCNQNLSDQLVQDFSFKNAAAAINSAHENGSDVLVFNVFGGTGFFAGARGDVVRGGNMNGIAEAMRLHKIAHPTSELKVMLPTQKRDLFNDEDFICHPCDKDKAAAYLARLGYKVSVHVAGDPMSITGVHGTGLWWQSCGMGSDEERVAFLTESYKGAYTPAELIDAGRNREVIPALSQFMVQK